MMDPIFVHMLALELGMTVSELGQRMSAHELTVAWPAFFKWRDMAKRREEERAEARRGRRR